MKKSILFSLCLCVLLLPLSVSARGVVGLASDPTEEGVSTDPPSVLTILKVAKDVKEKTSKKSSSSDEETASDVADDDDEASEDDSVAPLADDEDTVAESAAVDADDEESNSSSSGGVLGSILGGVASSATSTTTITNVIGDVIGLNKVSEKTLIGTWTYKEPGVGFTSDNLLAQAGGEVAATACRDQLVSAYASVGITPDNTSFTFNDDGSFTAVLAGHSVKGTYSFNQDDQTIALKVLILSITGHTKLNIDGMSLMFESQKILSLLETVCKATGSKTLSAIGGLTSAYDGVRIGFDMTK